MAYFFHNLFDTTSVSLILFSAVGVPSASVQKDAFFSLIGCSSVLKYFPDYLNIFFCIGRYKYMYALKRYFDTLCIFGFRFVWLHRQLNTILSYSSRKSRCPVSAVNSYPTIRQSIPDVLSLSCYSYQNLHFLCG